MQHYRPRRAVEMQTTNVISSTSYSQALYCSHRTDSVVEAYCPYSDYKCSRAKHEANDEGEADDNHLQIKQSLKT